MTFAETERKKKSADFVKCFDEKEYKILPMYIQRVTSI